MVTLRAGTATLLLRWRPTIADCGALRVSWRRLPALAGFGLITVTVFYLALLSAFAKTSVPVGTILLDVAPAVVTLGAARSWQRSA